MRDIVNILARIQREINDSGVTVRLEGDHVRIIGPAGAACLRIVRLYRPSADDVKREASPDVLLALTAASREATVAAAKQNYLSATGGGYRIIVPGIAVIHDSPRAPLEISRQVRLMGRTGVIAESLLLGSRREWSIRDLAVDAAVAPAMAHRVVSRLERETLVARHGSGPKTIRVLTNRRGLAELWSQEEKVPGVVFTGFLYGESLQAVARKVLDVCSSCAVGGALAANLYNPVLTTIAPPVRIWVPDDFDIGPLTSIGFQQTDAGANIEFVQAKGDPWKVHANSGSLRTVSKWRSWIEIANMEGRTQELAGALMSSMEISANGRD